MTRFSADIAPSAAAISGLTDRVAQFLQDAGVDRHAVHRVSLVVEELLANLVEHGSGADRPATVVLTVEPDRVIGEIGDWSAPFDPRAAPVPDTQAPLEERQIGGLGLHLVRQLTASLDYRREGQQNWTAFCILRGQAAKETGHGNQ